MGDPIAQEARMNLDGLKHRAKRFLGTRLGAYSPTEQWPLSLSLPSIDCVNVAQDFDLYPDKRPAREYPGWRKPEQVVVMDATPEQLQWLSEAAPGIEIKTIDYNNWSGSVDADVIMGWCSLKMVKENPRLRWVQLNTIGVTMDAARNTALLEKGILVSNLQRLTSPVVAEHAVALLLSLTRALPDYYQRQQKMVWDSNYVDMSRMHLLQGKTVLLTGFGSIGIRIAKMLHAMEMQVIVIRNDASNKPEWIESIGTLAALNTMVKRADVVINTLPDTSATQGLFNGAIFSAMKPSAYFINVGRGATVVTRDLDEALKTERIAGAAIDVIDPDPLPRGHPIWRNKTLIVTPHTAARTIAAKEREWCLYRENLKRYIAGESILSVVDLQRGY
jgi:phosphoglycerate dehydrogenase-like enzyme